MRLTPRLMTLASLIVLAVGSTAAASTTPKLKWKGCPSITVKHAYTFTHVQRTGPYLTCARAQGLLKEYAHNHGVVGGFQCKPVKPRDGEVTCLNPYSAVGTQGARGKLQLG